MTICIFCPGFFIRIALHPDNTKLYFTTTHSMEVLNVDGSGRMKLYTRGANDDPLRGIACDAILR